MLEVVLSLVLTSLVLLCVAMAVDAQLRIADAGRTHVEEAQLARVLLHQIADDVRCAVVADSLGLAGLSPSGSRSEDSGQEPSDSGNSDEADTEASEESATGTVQSEAAGSVASLVPSAVPGVYGESDWLQVDVGRPSRVRRQASADSENPAAATCVMGDVKTVAYYVVSGDDSATANPAESSGLVRRELDRSVTAWASEQGLVDQLQLAEAPVAAEVAAIEFRYSDGSTWYDSWDTAESGNLPMAVEIRLSLRPVQHDGNWATALASATGTTSPEEEELLVYRLIVDVPMARAKPATEASGGSGEMESGEMSEARDSDSPPPETP
ncbi:MAG: hypothetical protein HUU20_18320 [Pirellulales bacterium]|nr:hypothetical protein [Pirellulales bacterium]